VIIKNIVYILLRKLWFGVVWKILRTFLSNKTKRYIFLFLRKNPEACIEELIKLIKLRKRWQPIYFKRISSIFRFYLETPLLVPSMLCTWLVMERKYLSEVLFYVSLSKGKHLLMFNVQLCLTFERVITLKF